MQFIIEGQHAVGDHVEFNWNKFLNPEAISFWYDCIIIANHGTDQCYDVELIDNHVLNDPTLIYTKDGGPLVVGSIVCYNWRCGGNWYDYVVKKINEDRTVDLTLECLSVSSEFLRKPTEHEKYTVDETVEYDWGGGCNWFEGKVVAVNPNGTYDIALFDEAVSIEYLSLPTGLGPTELRPIHTMVTSGSLQEGQLVEYNWQGKGYWYLNYMVMKVLSDTTCDVQLIDKDICCSALRRKTTCLELELSVLEIEKVHFVNILREDMDKSIPVAEEVKPFAVGDVIEHNWNETGTWWNDYRITAVNDEDTSNPLYDLIHIDNSEVFSVSAALIRHPETEKEKAIRELPYLNNRINVLQSKLHFVRTETSLGKTNVQTLDAIEKLLEVILAEQQIYDEHNPAKLNTASCFCVYDTTTSDDVLKLTARLVAGREQALPCSDTTIARALFLKRELETRYYTSEEAKTKYDQLKNTANDEIYLGHYRESLKTLQESSRVWDKIVEYRPLSSLAIDGIDPDGVVKACTDRQIATCKEVLATKQSVLFKSGAVVDVYDPIAIENLKKVMMLGDDEVPDVAVVDATATVATAATTTAVVDGTQKECCYCHKPTTEYIIISHGDTLCVDCQHNSPLSVYYTNYR